MGRLSIYWYWQKPHTLNKKKRIPNEEDIERIIGG